MSEHRTDANYVLRVLTRQAAEHTLCSLLTAQCAVKGALEILDIGPYWQGIQNLDKDHPVRYRINRARIEIMGAAKDVQDFIDNGPVETQIEFNHRYSGQDELERESAPSKLLQGTEVLGGRGTFIKRVSTPPPPVGTVGPEE